MPHSPGKFFHESRGSASGNEPFLQRTISTDTLSTTIFALAQGISISCPFANRDLEGPGSAFALKAFLTALNMIPMRRLRLSRDWAFEDYVGPECNSLLERLAQSDDMKRAVV